MTRLAVFDCDGTLSDGQAGVVNAMDAAFAHVGSPAPPHAQVRRIVGLSLPQAIRQLAPDLPNATQAEVVEAYKQAFRRSREDGSLREPLFDGMADLLHRLHADGWLLGVATGKSDRGLASTLAVHGLADLFVSLHTADRHPSKPHPAMLQAAMDACLAQPETTCMIGDTVFDMQMAKAADVRAIGVAWGYHEPAELLEAGAVAVAGDVTELESLIHA
ncbi:HAD-IA family hydrolase [Aurantiacibacter poecillastricola]|uniref:HAD-IA family hydrolase n=1 Tax=Aurantiacibacter poecillastricola TaxID=3064385 RepID=UPI00273DD9BC|nr:HAD-IA family hydrolase [Aurantiacibacter sp. 219JJ12-13]MDP5262798.1 HAD-IA family hydrolase [Aurantiacibacter sp. 219JJ12-13]